MIETRTERLALVSTKALIASGGVALFLLPLATPPGLAAGVGGTILAYLLARTVKAQGLRLAAGLILGAMLIAAGQVASRLIMDRSAGPTGQTLQLADAVFFGLACLGIFFAVRLLSQRARVFSILELAVVVGAVAHTFADHRQHHIHQPRFLSDWAWARGIDPATVLEIAGVVTIVLAALMLLSTRRGSKLLLSLLFLILGGIATYLLTKSARIGTEADTNGLGLTKDEKDKDDGGGAGKSDSSSSGGRRKPPDPVAVVVLHDDLPEADVLYFRQAVLSHFNVDRLDEDKSGKFDTDVISRFPSGGPERGVPVQNPAFHRMLHTSVFLLVDHAQPFGVGNPVELRPLDNPDPRRFVAAYDVDSLFLIRDLGRLVGRTSMPAAWTEEQRKHYLDMPSDPRYLELSNRLVREIDPRFVGDDMMRALAIKRYLEKEGFYSQKVKTLVGNDPAGKFLFGDMHGYCVHFAHAAVMLLRSQGIPARVAIGYGVQTNRRGAGSSILILGSEAHAWPELFMADVGWVTFDIYPEHSDEPPPPPIDEDLESMLGELARKDQTGGKAADPHTRFEVPWALIATVLAALLGGLLVIAYGVKGVRRVRRKTHRHVYRAVLDRLSDVGAARQIGETRERHAARLLALAPSFTPLTQAHLRLALSPKLDPAPALPEVRNLARATRAELARNTPFFTRLLGHLNPVGWWLTR